MRVSVPLAASSTSSLASSTVIELATLVSISGAAASHLLRRDPEAVSRLSPIAGQIAAACWEEGAGKM
jgi:hypothetical protein